MLAEIFMLRLETAFRKENVEAPSCSSDDRRFVPINLPNVPRITSPTRD
jgi:hypothetical protein